MLNLARSNALPKVATELSTEVSTITSVLAGTTV